MADGTSTPRRTGQELAHRMLQRRATEAVVWGIPAVNYDLMLQALAGPANGGLNQIAYWSRLPDWKNQTLTPNPDTIYFMPFFSTKDAGPMVLEIPPAEGGSITGSIMDCWQAAFEDVGPAGVDQGKGGKYLILPPGHADEIPAGYIPLPSGNYLGYALLRSLLQGRGADDVAKAVAYGKRIRLYPLAQAADPPATVFVDAADALFDATIPYDLRFFESLNRMIQTEPWLERDRAVIDPLRSIGIQKGKPFAPDAETVQALAAAASEARDWFNLRYETAYAPHNAGHRWFLPADPDLVAGIENGFADTASYPTDGRGTAYYYAFSSIRHMGAGQFYLFACRDADGAPLDGSATYRLRIPADPPVRQYWSAVLYDFATHALIRDMPWSSRSSMLPDLKTNADGSVDVFFGPEAPPGAEANWIPTKAGGEFEALFRFYGPKPPLFDKTWILPDIERIA